jgi:hypothetical protein
MRLPAGFRHGDHSQALTRLAPGTRVAIEGPYGTFTADTATREKLLLVGAGVGTAPILKRYRCASSLVWPVDGAVVGRAVFRPPLRRRAAPCPRAGVALGRGSR